MIMKHQTILVVSSGTSPAAVATLEAFCKDTIVVLSDDMQETQTKFARDMERAGGTFLIEPGFNHLAVGEQTLPETRRERRARLRKTKHP